MFARRSHPDSDAAAAARRRLEALAAQFEVAASTEVDRVPRAGADGDPDGDNHWEQASPLEHSPPLPPAPGRHATRASSREDGRWGLTPQHVTIVALLVAAVVAAAGWAVLRAVPHAAPVQLASERSIPPTSGSTASATTSSGLSATTVSGGLPTTISPAAPSGSAMLVVDVAGRVRHPGIVELPAGARVVDALDAAGGPRPGVATSSLNLARPLVDGEQIVVGVRVPQVDLVPPQNVPGAASSTDIAGVDLNTATQEQLETLPGIGPVTAASILAWRGENGGFTSVDELLEVSGIGEVTLADIEAYVHV